MQDENLVSVIIPAKNRVDFTIEAVNSVVSQKLPKGFKLELIVIDNRSNPPLNKILKAHFNQVRVLRNNGFDSPGGSRNIGLKLAHGRYLSFLDNDDKWKPNFLKSSIEFIRKNNLVATVCLTNPYFFGNFSVNRRIRIIILNILRTVSLLVSFVLNNEKLPRSAFFLCQISHMLFDRKYIKHLTFNEKTVAAEDWEFNVNVSLDKSIGILPKALVNFRYEPRSSTYTKKVIKGKKEAYYNLIEKLPPSHKKGIFHLLFLLYIKFFLLK